MHEALRKQLSEEQLEGYLKRIGMIAEKDLTADYLDRIIRAQLRTVPFDDADVWVNGVEPSLATDDLYAKVVERKRGGYCFELNSLFLRLVQALGFKAHLVIVHLGRPGMNELNNPAHCAVIVNIDGVDRFCDVGYGGPVPDGSVPFTGEEVLGHKQSMNGVYTVVESKNPDGSFMPRFTFKNCPCDPTELIPLNFHVARREGSPFANHLMLNIRADNGFGEIGMRKFKFKDGDTYIEKMIESKEEAARLAAEYFGIPQLPVRDF